MLMSKHIKNKEELEEIRSKNLKRLNNLLWKVGEMLVQAILDRLLHHSHVISIKGESYRLKEKLDFFSNVSNS